MERTRADYLIETYGAQSPMDISEALALARSTFVSWPAECSEAEQLINACATFGEADLAWREIVVCEVSRYLLETDNPGALQVGAEDWLIATLTTVSGTINTTILALVQDIMHSATNGSERLGRFGLQAALGCLRAAAPAEALREANTAS